MAAARADGHEEELLHGTDTVGLTTATLLTRTRVVTVATAVGGQDVRKRCSIPTFVECSRHHRSRAPYFTGSTRIPATAREAISTTSSIGRRPCGNPARSPARKPRRFWLRHRSRRNTSIQPEQVRDRAGIVRTASRTNRSHVLDQRKQIGTRRRRNGNLQNRRSKRAPASGSRKKLANCVIVFGIGDAEQVLWNRFR